MDPDKIACFQEEAVAKTFLTGRHTHPKARRALSQTSSRFACSWESPESRTARQSMTSADGRSRYSYHVPAPWDNLGPCACKDGALKFALIWRLAATLAWFCLAAETCLMQMKAASTTVIEVPTQLDMSRQMTEARLALGATMDFPALSHVSMDLKSVNTPGLVFLEKLRARCAKMHMVSVTSHDAR